MVDKKVISKENFFMEMIKIGRDELDDEEMCHIRMDDLMCDTLRALGYGLGVTAFEDSEKSYA